MIVRLRLFLACLILLALPLQGALAASMMLCLPATAGAQHVAVPDVPDVHASGHAHHHASHEAATDDVSAAPAIDHQCGVCAFCGHALGLTRAQPALALAPAPQSLAAAPPARLDTRGLPVPDKPPRA